MCTNGWVVRDLFLVLMDLKMPYGMWYESLTRCLRDPSANRISRMRPLASNNGKRAGAINTATAVFPKAY